MTSSDKLSLLLIFCLHQRFHSDLLSWSRTNCLQSAGDVFVSLVMSTQTDGPVSDECKGSRELHSTSAWPHSCFCHLAWMNPRCQHNDTLKCLKCIQAMGIISEEISKLERTLSKPTFRPQHVSLINLVLIILLAIIVGYLVYKSRKSAEEKKNKSRLRLHRRMDATRRNSIPTRYSIDALNLMRGH